MGSYSGGVVAVFPSKIFQSPDLAFREYRTYDRVPSPDCLMQWLNLLSLSTVVSNQHRFQKKKKVIPEIEVIFHQIFVPARSV